MNTFLPEIQTLWFHLRLNLWRGCHVEKGGGVYRRYKLSLSLLGGTIMSPCADMKWLKEIWPARELAVAKTFLETKL